MPIPDKDPVLPEANTASIAHKVRAAREALGYSIDDLALTCGLATDEIVDIQNDNDLDPAKLRRIAAALRLPEGALIRS